MRFSGKHVYPSVQIIMFIQLYRLIPFSLLSSTGSIPKLRILKFPQEIRAMTGCFSVCGQVLFTILWAFFIPIVTAVSTWLSVLSAESNYKLTINKNLLRYTAATNLLQNIALSTRLGQLPAWLILWFIPPHNLKVHFQFCIRSKDKF